MSPIQPRSNALAVYPNKRSIPQTQCKTTIIYCFADFSCFFLPAFFGTRANQ